MAMAYEGIWVYGLRVYTSLDVHEEGRDFVVLDSRPDDAYNAVGAQTVLSMPLAKD
jgi:hypothetical protein